jgi:RNA polymerase-associated protein CTR9
MASQTNGLHHFERFSELPIILEIPVHDGGGEESVELPLEDLPSDDTTELCTLLENEHAARTYWVTIALAYAKQNQLDNAIDVLDQGFKTLREGPGIDNNRDKASYLSALCWMYMWKTRESPRLRPEGERIKTKEDYLAMANSKLNELARLSPSYSTLQLARGVLSLLKASIPSQSRSGPSAMDTSDRERSDNLRVALNCFEATLRANNRNFMALFGKARVHYSTGDYQEALKVYQDILSHAPHLNDPDPRIGIGCCFWQLGFKEDAKLAWDRALEVNPDSKQANILLGIYWLQHSSQHPTNHPDFINDYKKAMSLYTQKAFKTDEKMPLACSTFAAYFQMRHAWDSVEKLSARSIQYTDVNAIASDGWYLIARKAHQESDYVKAQESYIKSDQARGGDEKGYVPAKFGAAQIQVLLSDHDGAKFRLDKLNNQVKTVESQTLLGTLLSETIFGTKPTNSNKEEMQAQRKKAVSLLESVRSTWKDPKKQTSPDISVLLSLARLYELDSPEKSLLCLKHVEEIELEAVSEDMINGDTEDEVDIKQAKRELLPPELLNNLGCFHYSIDKFTEARDYFQTALNACLKAKDKDGIVDTDALVTSISYNLGRTYEVQGLLDEAQAVFEGLVARHANYSDALARLAFISFQKNADSGSEHVKALLGRDSANMDVRALYGWLLNRTKRRVQSVSDDAEQKHGKATLTTFDKYDQYVLTSMGNIWLASAREMRREEDKERRRKAYERAMDFFGVALQHDPNNAYAAQGVAIVLAEDKKDYTAAVQIFTNVRETMKDATVYMNLGHVFCELKQFKKAIENYELALEKKERVSEVAVLSALGRAWYHRGRQEKDIVAFKKSLDYSKRVLENGPDQSHYQFNVAFVQFHIAQHLCSVPVAQRTLEDVETASADLESAIESLFTLSKHPTPPYPRSDLEQRANMGRTLTRQLERALNDQKSFTEQNSARLAAARDARAAEVKRREEEKKAAEQEAEQRKAKIQEERQKILERDRLIAEQRAEEDKRHNDGEMTTDTETGERKKRVKAKRTPGTGGGRKRRSKGGEADIVSDGHLSADEGKSDEDGEGGSKPKTKPKKRRLVQQSKKNSKFKSSEMIEDSDEEAGMLDGEEAVNAPSPESSVILTPAAVSEEEDGGEEQSVQRRDKKRSRVIEDDDDDDE